MESVLLIVAIARARVFVFKTGDIAVNPVTSLLLGPGFGSLVEFIGYSVHLHIRRWPMLIAHL